MGFWGLGFGVMRALGGWVTLVGWLGGQFWWGTCTPPSRSPRLLPPPHPPSASDASGANGVSGASLQD